MSNSIASSSRGPTIPLPIPVIPPPNVPISKTNLKAQHHLASGALSGLCSAVCLQPLDLLKTRLQQRYEGTQRRRVGTVVREVVRDDGVTGLWRGTVPTLVRNVPGVALYFYMLSAIRGRLSITPYFQTTPLAITVLEGSTSSKTPVSSSSSLSSRTALVKLSNQGNLLAGAIARTSVGFILNPITILKARYESTQFHEYRSLWGAFRSLVQTEGIRGLFQGVTATAVRDAPYAGLSLTFYEKGKEVAGRMIKPEWGVPNAVLHSGSAAAAAVLATLATSPADCVKTRMQVNPTDHPTLRRAIIKLYQDRGIPGFFSGSSLRIFRKAASGAIAWTVYESILLFVRDQGL
ncbi:mitochondrial carrier domain-containing protein [Kockovaella imperatae]|uniref:Mitochondrial glycine transporter n=1 Tax=Kockovaella imperatae TaxID=4999 RepID=A0A1Y1UJX9_9TREE|nr:mitochondrial carrier domain-containing protein [Kockovaella imperatae]ORX38358.1 mitochondrial carrier domain-containing protein [Kockovaella imperatae]